MDWRRIVLAVCCTAVLGPPVLAQDTTHAPAQPNAPPAAAFDPLDPASCATMDGHTAVYIAYMKAWDAATKDGRLQPQQSQKLAEWLVAMDNWMIETNQTKVHCEQLIAVRKQNGF